MRRSRGRRGLTLLEIILALAILAGAVAVLSQLSRGGLENARVARDLTRAELLCESKLAEVAAGLVTLESQEGIFESDVDPQASDWIYTIEVGPAAQTGLVEVRVTVSKDPAVDRDPVEFTLTRWMADPATESATTESAVSESSVSTEGGGL
jgi:type II secretion system protein I